MSTEQYIDGVLVQRWDDETREVISYDVETGEVTGTRPYTAEENADADAAAAQKLLDTNQRTVEQAVAEDLAAMQAIIADTNANINQNPASRIKTIARAIRRLDRMVLRDFTGTD